MNATTSVVTATLASGRLIVERVEFGDETGKVTHFWRLEGAVSPVDLAHEIAGSVDEFVRQVKAACTQNEKGEYRALAGPLVLHRSWLTLAALGSAFQSIAVKNGLIKFAQDPDDKWGMYCTWPRGSPGPV